MQGTNYSSFPARLHKETPSRRCEGTVFTYPVRRAFERVLAGEVDATLLVDLRDLDPGHVADVQDVFDLLDSVVFELEM